MPLLNAHLAPVLSVDNEGPPVTAARLGIEALQAHFAAPPPWEPEMRGEQPFVARAPLASAVLVGLVMREALTVLLTRRALHLSAHPGQISFPGGRVEPQDRGPADTALREAQEEIGLPPGLVQVLGCLPDYTTGTGFVVTPVVGLVTPDFHPRIDASEVAEVFEVPLSFLMTPAHHRRHEVDWAGQRRAFWSMLWPRAPQAGGTVDGEDYLIWGATAAMLRNLYRFLLAGSP
jgi:8-oxo-dGTP pyrophosphatase MutT (NUDIX family)